jgi:hypothetical protein
MPKAPLCPRGSEYQPVRQSYPVSTLPAGRVSEFCFAFWVAGLSGSSGESNRALAAFHSGQSRWGSHRAIVHLIAQAFFG